jgi:hypothetical protein
MSGIAAPVADAAADARWRAWQAVGLQQDRKRETNSVRVLVVLILGLVIWFALLLI